MAAANTDKFRKVARRFVSQVGGGGIADASTTTGPLASTSGLPTDTAVDITFDRVDTSGGATSSLEETVTGVVSGSNLTDMLRAQEGTAQAHTAGKVAENLWNAKTWNDAVDGILVEHNQDGTHKSPVVTLTSTSTLTNKRITKRVGTATSSATHTINSDSYDVYTITAQAAAFELEAPSGTPTSGQTLIVRIKDNGTARAITWHTGSSGDWRALGVTLPTTTVLSKTLYIGAIWNSTDSRWDVIATAQEA